MNLLACVYLLVVGAIPILAQSSHVPIDAAASKPGIEARQQNNQVYAVSVLNDNSWHFWLPFGFNVLVALGGFVSVYFLYRQTKAATLNVEAVLKGQRAWLLVKPEPVDINSYPEQTQDGGRAHSTTD